jgi:hypothetical protein
MKKSIRIVLATLTLAASIICGYWLKGFLVIDHCLDNGGRWNYDRGECEYVETNRTYRNSFYQFSFDYASDFTLKRLGKWSFDLLKKDTPYLHGSVEDTTFKIFIKELKESGDNFRRFARTRVKTVCSADGPDGSRYCETIGREKEYTTPHGLEVLEFSLILTQEHHETHTKETSTVGPLYMVNISRKNHYRALMLYPGNSTVSPDKTRHLAQEIVSTLRLVN